MLLLSFITSPVFSQTDSTKTSVTVAAMYSSNANYYGQTTDQQLPVALGNITVTFPFGVYLNSSIYQLLTAETAGTAVAIGAGYDKNITEKLTAGIAFSHTFFPPNSPLLQASNSENLSASLSYAYWLTSALSADYAFGKEKDVFITFTNSKSFNLGSLIDENDYLSFEPGIELIAGTQHYYESYIIQRGKSDKSQGKPATSSNNGNSPNNGNNVITTYVPASNFGLLASSIRLPFAYNRSSYLIEAAYQLAVPAQRIEGISIKPNSFFNLSFYYQF